MSLSAGTEEIESAIGPVRTRSFGPDPDLVCPRDKIIDGGQAVSASPPHPCKKTNPGPTSNIDTDFGVLGLEWTMGPKTLSEVGSVCAEEYDSPPSLPAHLSHLGTPERGPARAMQARGGGNRYHGNVTDLVVGVQSFITTGGPIVEFGYGDKISRASEVATGVPIEVWKQAEDDEYYACPLVRIRGTKYSCDRTNGKDYYALALSFACPHNRPSRPISPATRSRSASQSATTNAPPGASAAAASTLAPTGTVGSGSAGVGNGLLLGALALVALALTAMALVTWRRRAAASRRKQPADAPHVDRPAEVIAMADKPADSFKSWDRKEATVHKDQEHVPRDSLYLPGPMPAPGGRVEWARDDNEELYIGGVPHHHARQQR